MCHSPFGDWIESREVREVPEREATTRVECAAWFGARDAALRSHATQVDPDGFFFAVPRDLEARIWPVEEFELADARVPTDAARGRPVRRGACGGRPMSGLLWLATPSGSTLDAYDISPGLIGFAVTLAVAVAAILLLVNMTGKLRRIERRAEHEQARRARAAGRRRRRRDRRRGRRSGRPDAPDGPASTDGPAPRRADEV